MAQTGEYERGLFDSQGSEYCYRQRGTGQPSNTGVEAIGTQKCRKKKICFAVFTLAAVIIAGLLCALLSLWLVQHRPFTIAASIDASGLPKCTDETRQGCYRLQNELVVLVTVGQPLAPLSAEAAEASASVQLSADGAGLRVRRPGLYQIDAQVTFAEPDLEDNVAAFLLVNGRQVVQCHRFRPAGAAALPCPLAFVRRLATGDRVALSTDAHVGVAVDPSLTYLAVSDLPLTFPKAE